jgi:hypothetical protein
VERSSRNEIKKLEEAMKNKENGKEETKDKLDDDLSKWTLKQWWEHLKPAHFASIGTALAVLLSGAFSLGVMLSGGSGAKLLGGL